MDRHNHREGAALKYFSGLDVSLEETGVCVVDDTGEIVKEFRVASDPEALITVLRQLGLSSYSAHFRFSSSFQLGHQVKFSGNSGLTYHFPGLAPSGW